MGLAIHTYHDTNDAIVPYGRRDRLVPTWYFRMFPFIEQGPLWSRLPTDYFDDMGSQSKQTGWYSPECVAVRKIPISIFRCPSFPGLLTYEYETAADKVWERQYGCYAVNMGPTNLYQDDWSKYFPADQVWWKPSGQPFTMGKLDISFGSATSVQGSRPQSIVHG